MRGLRTLTIVAATFASGAALAAADNSREAYYRCKDSKGQILYGDRMPDGCQGQDTEILNNHGMVLRVVEGDQARNARVLREVTENKERRQREQRQQRDRMLLETYLSVDDIERLRDQRIELLMAQHRATEQTIANMRERQSRLESQLARFKPYSDKPGAPPVPDHLAEEMVNTVNSLRVYHEALQKNQAEQADVKSAFSADIKRFKELKGVH